MLKRMSWLTISSAPSPSRSSRLKPVAPMSTSSSRYPAVPGWKSQIPASVQHSDPPLDPTTITSGSASPLRSWSFTSSAPAPNSRQPSQTTFGITCENAETPLRVIVSFAPWVLNESPLQLKVAVTAPLVTDSSSARATGTNTKSASAAARSVVIREASRAAGGLSLGERPRNYGAHHLAQKAAHRVDLVELDDAVAQRLGDEAAGEQRQRLFRRELLAVLGGQCHRVGGGTPGGYAQLEDGLLGREHAALVRDLKERVQQVDELPRDPHA